MALQAKNNLGSHGWAPELCLEDHLQYGRVAAMGITRPIRIDVREAKDLLQSLDRAPLVGFVRLRECAVDVEHHQLHGVREEAPEDNMSHRHLMSKRNQVEKCVSGATDCQTLKRKGARLHHMVGLPIYGEFPSANASSLDYPRGSKIAGAVHLDVRQPVIIVEYPAC